MNAEMAGPPAKRECTTRCHQGEYCLQDECKSCPDGSYQKVQDHTNVSCKQWTFKSERSHYVIAKNGSSTSDIVYKCADGYEEKQFTVNGKECREIITSTADIKTTTVLPNRTSGSLPTTTAGIADATTVSQGLNGGEVAAIVFFAVTVIIALFVLFWCWWKQKMCFDTRSRRNKNINATTPGVAEVGIPLIEHGEQRSVFSYDFFHNIVEKLGYNDTIKFLQVLEDPSSMFNFEDGQNHIRDQEPDIKLTKICQEWSMANSENEHRLLELIKKALNDIQCAHRFPELFRGADHLLEDDMPGQVPSPA